MKKNLFSIQKSSLGVEKRKHNFSPDLILFDPSDLHRRSLSKVLVKITDSLQVFKSIEDFNPLSLREGAIILLHSCYWKTSFCKHSMFLESKRLGIPIVVYFENDKKFSSLECIDKGISEILFYDNFFDTKIKFELHRIYINSQNRLENNKLNKELHNSLEEVVKANNQLQNMIKNLKKEARTDSLTGLANRRWSSTVLESRWEEARRHNISLAFVMIDLDKFKPLNDRLGHQSGDDCLKLAAKVIKSNCRKIDLPARFGGDEFSILMPHTSPEDAIKAGERISKAFAEEVKKLFPDSETSMSVGISHIDVSMPQNISELINQADYAMYKSKLNGSSTTLAKITNKNAA